MFWDSASIKRRKGDNPANNFQGEREGEAATISAPLGTLQWWKAVETHEAFHRISLILGVWVLVEHSKSSVSSLYWEVLCFPLLGQTWPRGPAWASASPTDNWVLLGDIAPRKLQPPARRSMYGQL